ncbi:hypothetical protein [Williamsia sterculiae]|uniref:Uncharacterized protein n=1 Tax=Williamsia sterculiae TaxID=1344003 RepID=A0A1N7FCS4_9NOCA|nr:hypothetical protein [Williamsia sterculiae]SIR98026.1 hypothetical protein SAMN05445060_1930 [Williamsia sterculiae]
MNSRRDTSMETTVNHLVVRAEHAVAAYRNGGSLDELAWRLEDVIQALSKVDFAKAQKLITQSWGDIEIINATALHRNTPYDRQEIEELIEEYFSILTA